MDYSFDFDLMNNFGIWFATVGIVILVVCMLANIGLAFIPASIAKRKGYSAGAFWCIGFFGGFILGTIIACAIPDRTVPPPWYRGVPMGYAPPVPPVAPVAPPPVASRSCPQCGTACKADAAFCLKCGARL